MAFEFPASPTTGEVSNGFQWDGEKWKGGQPSGPQKEQFFDLSGKTSQVINVPTWAKAVQLNGTAFLAGVTPSVGMRLSSDGTTFAAGASDYANVGPVLNSGSSGYQAYGVTNNSYMMVSVSGDNLNVPHVFTVDLGLARPNTSAVFHAKIFSRNYDSAAASAGRTGVPTSWGGPTGLTIKALQIFTPNGAAFGANSYLHIQWLGDDAQVPISNAISEAYADTRYVNVTGDTMSGNLTLAKTNPLIALNKSNSGETAAISGTLNTKQRWYLQLGDGAAESGANSGSDFSIWRANDAGTLVDPPLAISRATGATTMLGDLTFTKASPLIVLDKSAATQHAAICGKLNGLHRWFLSLGAAVAESGGNVGSDFAIYRYNDAGSFVDSPLSIARATGVVTATGLATKPQGTAGIGQWVNVSPAAGAAWTIPAGGTWTYTAQGFNASTMTLYSGFTGGVAAGGTTIFGATGNVIWTGFAWRIA